LIGRDQFFQEPFQERYRQDIDKLTLPKSSNPLASMNSKKKVVIQAPFPMKSLRMEEHQRTKADNFGYSKERNERNEGQSKVKSQRKGREKESQRRSRRKEGEGEGEGEWRMEKEKEKKKPSIPKVCLAIWQAPFGSSL